MSERRGNAPAPAGYETAMGGKFAPAPPTDEQIAFAISEARKMGFVHLLLVGERGNGTCGMVTVNMASINHTVEVLDRAMNQLPQWKV
jgi:hypothetical protein